MKGAIKDYAFKQKSDWRGCYWNRFVERLPVMPAEAVVIGLFGRESHDAESALRRGIRRENLVAVDLDRGAIKLLRRRGITAIESKLSAVLNAWSGPCHVIVADFCAGLTRETSQALGAIVSRGATFRDVVVVFNGLRGRDAFPILPHMTSLDLARLSLSCERGPGADGEVEKHRGLLAFGMMLGLTCLNHGVAGPLLMPIAQRRMDKPSLFQYASRTQVFDSMVVRWRASDFFMGGDDLSLDDPAAVADAERARRLITAAKAVRTSRLLRACR